MVFTIPFFLLRLAGRTCISEACMKKILFFMIAALTLGVSSVRAAGGMVPCLATCLLGDSRIGIYMNEGKQIENADWIVVGGNLLGGAIGSVLPPVYESTDGNVTMKVSISLPLGRIYAGFDAYQKSKSAKGFCAGVLWGRRVGAEINTTKVRTLEILECVPVVCIYPCIALPMEAYNGKTMSQVIQEEGLAR
jgi:hypothetical protein